MKEDAILAFHVGEFGWELLRMAPHVLWTKRKKYNNKVKLIVCSREDRYDFYGDDVDIFHPFQPYNPDMKQDCFKLTGFKDKEYYDFFNYLVRLYSKDYNIVEKICPKIDGRKYTQKNQFSQKQMDYNFKPRINNAKWCYHAIQENNPLIILAPRYRKDMPRNWPHWQEFFDLIEPLREDYNFFICGKDPDVISDKKSRYYQITNIDSNNKYEISLTGITIELIKRSILTIGSQSGIPNLSNILGTPTLQWGNEKHEHTKTYNINNTETIFLEDKDFNIDPKIVFNELMNFLKKGNLNE